MMAMKAQDRTSEEAIHRLLSHSRPDRPGDDFASRIMERVLATEIAAVRFYVPLKYKLLFAGAGFIVLLMMFFPAWTLFDIDFNPGTAVYHYLRDFTGILSLKVMEVFKSVSTSKLPIIVPIGSALILLLGLDQILRRPASQKHATA
jgi:hypothetical protein